MSSAKAGSAVSDGCLGAFGIDAAEATALMEAVGFLSPSPLIFEPTGVFDYGRLHEIPEAAFDLYRRSARLRLTHWEQEAIRASLNRPDGALRHLLDAKAAREGVTETGRCAISSTPRPRARASRTGAPRICGSIASASESSRRASSRSGPEATTRRSMSTPRASAS